MDPIPSDLVPYYQGGYGAIPQSLSELRAIASPEKYRLDVVLRYKSAGRLLEIGPWMGLFSSNAKDAGFDVSAIEMDANCVEFLNQVLKIRAIQSIDPAATLDNISEKFDVIALWHCLEHLREPWRVLASAAACLAPGGILLVAIPNIESFQFSVLKRAWKHLDAPRHLYFFPAGLLNDLCSQHGLSTLKLTTHDHLSSLLSRDAWNTYAESIIPLPAVSHPVSVLLRRVLSGKEKRVNAGAGLTAIFQRPAKSGI